jgi:hypothetical protein
MSNYADLTEPELEDAANDRASLREAQFSVEQTGNQLWLAAFKQGTALGEGIMMSSEGQDKQTAIRTLLMADDLQRGAG